MALIKCPECGKEISDTAKNCIHCGYVLKEDNNIVQPQTVVIAPEKGKSAKNSLNIGVIIFLIISSAFILLNSILRFTINDITSDFNEVMIRIYDISFFFTIVSAIQSVVIFIVPKIRKKWFLVLYLIINLFVLFEFLVFAVMFLNISMLFLCSIIAYILGYVFVIKSIKNKE